MKRSGNWRLNIVLIIVLLFGAAVISRLFFLQILERKLFQAQALGQQVGISTVSGARGKIFCQQSQENRGQKSSGEIKSLAINKSTWIISAAKEEIVDKKIFAEKLSQITGQTEEEILQKFEGDNSYVVIKKDLSAEDLEKIKKLDLKGISWQSEQKRFYPQGKLASQVLGFLGGEGAGQYGVEGFYEDILQGKTGVKKEKTGLVSVLENEDNISLEGSDIYLTIDYNIQFFAETLLKKEQQKNDIESGQIIVLKPDTGKILALANFPSFDSNQYSKEKNMEIFQNSAVQKLFEPGSIMKPFTMAAAINEGKITPDTTYVDTGEVIIGKDSIHNFNNEKMGLQTMTEALENSLNTGAVFAQQKISHEKFLDYLEKFGFDEKTGIDLQGEVFSNNNLLKNGPDFNFATASFGQGIEMTPIQIARAYCALANGGKLVKPYITENAKQQISSDIIVSEETISKINMMLVNVVEKGFNSVAKIPGYYIAGKTGTAEVPLKNGKGYEQNKTIQSFAGYGPAFAPEFLILVKLDNPKVPKSALSAVPIFKELAQYIINYWKIPPDYDINKK